MQNNQITIEQLRTLSAQLHVKISELLELRQKLYNDINQVELINDTGFDEFKERFAETVNSIYTLTENFGEHINYLNAKADDYENALRR